MLILYADPFLIGAQHRVLSSVLYFSFILYVIISKKKKSLRAYAPRDLYLEWCFVMTSISPVVILSYTHSFNEYNVYYCTFTFFYSYILILPHFLLSYLSASFGCVSARSSSLSSTGIRRGNHKAINRLLSLRSKVNNVFVSHL